MSGTDLLIKNLAKTITEMPGKRPSAYDTQAEVRRVEGNTAWVHIPGGVDETPVQLTTNAKKGDVVQVRVSGGRAWLYGNATAPPTDDTTAKEAKKTAAVADEHATNAVTSAMLAQQAADDAQNAASQANTLLNHMEEAAEAADTTLTGIYQDAKDAKDNAEIASRSAESAQTSATSAYNSANVALTQLSVVENIVGVLDLISKNGTYDRTQDITPQPDKWYFAKSGSGTTADPYVYTVVRNVVFEYVLTSDTTIVSGKPYYTRSGEGTEESPYVYTPVENPVQADIGTYYENTNWNYYELTDIDEAIQNYVSSHLVLDDNGLNLLNGATKILLSTTQGLVMYDQTGAPIAQYGEETVIGNLNDFGIKIGESPESTQQTPIYELGFYQDGNRVAYINNNSLYITQTVVLRQMQMGDSLGIWAWCIHEVNAKNNLYLKWLG